MAAELLLAETGLLPAVGRGSGREKGRCRARGERGGSWCEEALDSVAVEGGCREQEGGPEVLAGGLILDFPSGFVVLVLLQSCK